MTDNNRVSLQAGIDALLRAAFDTGTGGPGPIW